MMSYHQLREHAVQLIVSWHRQCRLHGLQGEVLPQPVGDLWVVIAVKTTEDEGEATAATAAALPWSHGCPMRPAGQAGRVGGSFGGLFTASSTSEFGLRQRVLWTRRGDTMSFQHKTKSSLK